MDQAINRVHAARESSNVVEIVVHVSDNLDDQQRRDLVAALEQKDGIVSAEFCPLRYHLMLVRYDRDQYSSQDVLKAFGAQHVDVRLIGPI